MSRGPEEDIQWKTKEIWFINTSASLIVLKGKGTVNVHFNDLFKEMKFGFDSNKPYKHSGQFNRESQTTYLGFNYRFGI